MITNNSNEIFEQFDELRAAYPGLSIRECEHHFEIIGMLDFSATYNDTVIDGVFDILIKVPLDFPMTLPVVWEVGGRVPKYFHHFVDHSLCLGSKLNMYIKLSSSPTLITYVQDLLIPYLYSYRYLELYGELPYGELSHDEEGILECYSEQFGTDSHEETLCLLEALTKQYRGHLPCPCGSDKKTRNCHGEIIKKLSPCMPKEAFLNDLNRCRYYLLSKRNGTYRRTTVKSLSC